MIKSALKNIRLYWHTVRYLKTVQIVSQLKYRLYHPRPDLRPPSEIRDHDNLWINSVPKSASMLGANTFCFLNKVHDVSGPSAWNSSTQDKLWLYNLHYFDDLCAFDHAARQDWHRYLLLRWVDENPPASGIGWEPYPTSIRIVNWIKWSLFGNRPPSECLHTLAIQSRWLSRRLEHHLLGNHLFANAKALVFAGAFFVGPEADRWRTLGLRLLARELDEQILPDGGHFERSPLYHAILLEDVLDLINLAGAYPGLFDMTGTGALDRTVARARADAKARTDAVAHWRATAIAMLRWLAAMTHPDGEISFFNDAAMGIAPPLAELVAYAARLGIAAEVAPAPPCCWLRDSGYVRLAAGPAVALLDVAPIGPDYLPGHAHADTLSFELSLFGQRVIVNGGTSRYGSGPERLAERGTAAHSTVQIDGADSSEVWGGFRVALRARPQDVRVHPGLDPLPPVLSPAADGARAGVLEVSAAHDGYCRLSGRPVHRRAWCLTAGHLAVTDRIEGQFAKAVARFHLHPAVRVVYAETDGAGGADGGNSGASQCHHQAGQLLLPGGQRVTWRVTAGVARLMPDQWRPQFGLSLPSQCLEVRFTHGQCQLDLVWAAGE